MTDAQMFFYGCYAVATLAFAGVWFSLLRVETATWNKIGEGIRTAGMMVFFAAAFVAIVIPVYIATRLGDGLQAFMDAALPEVSGLVYRVRATARAHAEHRLAGWRQSVEYDAEDHRQKMARFHTDEDDASDAPEEAWLGGAANVEGDYLRY